jgi:IS5 family transposase
VEDLLADPKLVAQHREQVLESLRTEEQLTHHQERPSITEKIQRTRERTHLPIGLNRHQTQDTVVTSASLYEKAAPRPGTPGS